MDEGATLLQIPDQASDLAKTLSEHAHKQPSILVVDDEAAICEVIEKFLQNFGYRIFPFTNPFEALEFLEKEPIDVVLTDLQMGDVSGVDILRKAHQCQPDAVVILISGYPTVENAVQVLKEGAYDYITKPFRLDELGKVVQRGLEKQRLSREVVILRETLSLYRISEAMNSSLELPQVLQMILNSAITEAQCDNGCIILSSENEERLVIGASEAYCPQVSNSWINCPFGGPRLGGVSRRTPEAPSIRWNFGRFPKIRDFRFESPEGQLLNLYANGEGPRFAFPCGRGIASLASFT
jgi:DNA-binding response OmpR family regulator